MPGHSPFAGGPPRHFSGQHSSPAARGALGSRGGRRPTINPVVIGRAAHEATGFDKDALNRSMKILAATMGPNSDFKQWKRDFLNFLSIKAAYLIPQLAIRESGARLDEQVQHYAYTLRVHAASANKRANHALKCVSHARPCCATAAWDIVCERLDCRSFAPSLSLLDNLMLRQRPYQSLIDYVHFHRQTFDEYNETCQVIDESAAIPQHILGLLMLRGPFGQAKQCVINAFDTNYLMSADEVMANTLHLAQNMDENAGAPSMPAPDTSPSHI
jgi:hypothetical protein